MGDKKNFAILKSLIKTTTNKSVGVKENEIEEALEKIIKHAKISHLGEYIRSYKYSRLGPTTFQRKLLYPEDSLLKNDCIKYIKAGEYLGHNGQVERISFDHSNRFFFSGGADGVVKLWDSSTGFLVHSFIAHRDLVNDICISTDGNFMVSCDSIGHLTLWSLKTFLVIFSLNLECEISFAEFFDSNTPNLYNLVVVLATGVIKTFTFNKEGVTKVQNNLSLSEEIIKNICISDGGRFLMCGGRWPCLVVFDTLNDSGCYIFDTNGEIVNTICASKQSLRIAVACESEIIQWSFYKDGNSTMGTFKRRRKKNMVNLEGFWRKSVIKIVPQEDFGVDRMCYLKDLYLVCVYTDFKIRIYAGSELIHEIDSEEIGVVVPHPNDNIFAFYGSHLRIYKMNKLLYEEALVYAINDAQFSNDGELFIYGDESGTCKVLSINVLSEGPKEQFFESDFEHMNSAEENCYIECKKEYTLTINRSKNNEWVPTEYKVVPKLTPSIVLIECNAFSHIFDDFFTADKFKKKYLLAYDTEVYNEVLETDLNNFGYEADAIEINEEGYDDSFIETESDDFFNSESISDIQVPIRTNFVGRRSLISEESDNSNNFQLPLRRNQVVFVEEDFPIRRMASRYIIEDEDSYPRQRRAASFINNDDEYQPSPRRRRAARYVRDEITSSTEESSEKNNFERAHLNMVSRLRRNNYSTVNLNEEIPAVRDDNFMFSIGNRPKRRAAIQNSEDVTDILKRKKILEIEVSSESEKESDEEFEDDESEDDESEDDELSDE